MIENDNFSSKKKIRVKIFDCNNQTYCYDVGSNHIMQIDAVLGAALEIYNYSNESEVLAILGGKYGKEPVMDQCPDIMDSIHYTSPEDDIIKMGYEFLLKNREKKQ